MPAVTKKTVSPFQYGFPNLRLTDENPARPPSSSAPQRKITSPKRAPSPFSRPTPPSGKLSRGGGAAENYQVPSHLPLPIYIVLEGPIPLPIEALIGASRLGKIRQVRSSPFSSPLGKIFIQCCLFSLDQATRDPSSFLFKRNFFPLKKKEFSIEPLGTNKRESHHH